MNAISLPVSSEYEEVTALALIHSTKEVSMIQSHIPITVDIPMIIEEVDDDAKEEQTDVKKVKPNQLTRVFALQILRCQYLNHKWQSKVYNTLKQNMQIARNACRKSNEKITNHFSKYVKGIKLFDKKLMKYSQELYDTVKDMNRNYALDLQRLARESDRRTVEMINRLSNDGKYCL